MKSLHEELALKYVNTYIYIHELQSVGRVVEVRHTSMQVARPTTSPDESRVVEIPFQSLNFTSINLPSGYYHGPSLYPHMVYLSRLPTKQYSKSWNPHYWKIFKPYIVGNRLDVQLSELNWKHDVILDWLNCNYREVPVVGWAWPIERNIGAIRLDAETVALVYQHQLYGYATIVDNHTWRLSFKQSTNPKITSLIKQKFTNAYRGYLHE